MTDTLAFSISITDPEHRDILIARLAAAGATGFEEERDLLKAFADDDPAIELSFEEIINEQNLSYSKSIIQQQNWNALWEADFQPVSIGKFCMIRAEFHKPGIGFRHELVITPKMSFGTGHHATTHLMIEAMENLDLHGKDIFDFGTGTGVLAILAEQCGAEKITAIDNDEWSINNATENFKLNECHKIQLINANSLFNDFMYDVILANINRHIILQQLGSMQQHLAKNGVVLLSGLLHGDEAIIVEEASRQHLKLRQKSSMNGWICLLMVGE